ncbi:hypothetical protein [Actinomadura madurae]|uniref:hypothetical protein n=1 Tax=Actinomadura madurae TaxID=1993 RepID=UPI0020D23886|nr:hypothetical protein [Actinomadura madurae]MCP9951054.1 hypothetical protein [Actinomadura madurae]MCP9967837.1 hypothetical protein [Actinomadura madurae]MCP9980290.1 hypothetical protein [Actinomadura madurae]MCQ0008192.1 hypothetical protein [Actinomadura madurae]MCQ0016500.1 hypothetical protein [Actinomadura madurae]
MVLRSSRWFARDDEVGLEHRAAMRAAGRPVSRHEDRPVIGILNSAGDLNPCNLPFAVSPPRCGRRSSRPEESRWSCPRSRSAKI